MLLAPRTSVTSKQAVPTFTQLKNGKRLIYKKLTLSKSKKLNLTKSKKIAPNDIYPNVLELSKMTSTNKNKKTNRLEYLSKIALTTIQHLKQIGPRLFSRRNK